MTSPRIRINDAELDRLFGILLKGLKENAELDEKKKIVNSILPVYKYKLLKRFLSDEFELILNFLPIFLDERTKFLDFYRYLDYQPFVKSILELIPRYCPNIETVDFRNVWIKFENIENIKTFLRETTQLKSLRVICKENNNCAIHNLLLRNNFDQHDQNLKNGLLKIEFIDGSGLRATACATLLNRLPNLKSFGFLDLTMILHGIGDEDDLKKLSNITEFFGFYTSLTSMESFVKFCPNANKITLLNPRNNVIGNLSRFPLLTTLTLQYVELTYFANELINLLKIIGKRIKRLSIFSHVDLLPDSNILHELCPKLIKLDLLKHPLI